MTKKITHYVVHKYWVLRQSNQDMFNKNAFDIEGVYETFEKKHVQVAIGKYEDYTIIYIMGSNEFKDWLYNFSFPFMQTPYKKEGTNKKIKMHSGFYKSYKYIRAEIHSRVKDKTKVLLMGQSFGAAIASITALDLQYNFPKMNIFCITTGSPRVGNKVLVDSYNKRVKKTTRYVYGSDIVTRVPFRWMGYKHIGTLKQLSKKKFFPSIKDHLYPKGYLKEL